MSPLSNSIYSSVFTYNPNVLTRLYLHLTTKASLEPHHITCVLLDINVLIVRFGGRARACKVDTSQAIGTNSPPFNKSFLASYMTNYLITMYQMMDYPYQRV